MKRASLWMFTFSVGLFLVLPAQASLYTVTSGNSSFTVDDCNGGCSQDHGPGMISWTVDGVQTLYQQWFWFRVGSSGPEQSVDALNLISANVVGTGLDMLYGGDGFEVRIQYTLAGGQSGTGTADIGTQITTNNTGMTSLDYHFFQYADFDLGQNLIDTVAISANSSFGYWEQRPVSGNLEVVEIATPGPDYYEANYFANTLVKFYDGSASTLDNTSAAGPGDVTWAFEWDRNIAPGGSFLISKDMMLAPVSAVPEPTSITLLGVMGGFLLLASKKLSSRLI